MASLGSLVIELAANTARLQSDMGKAVNIVQGAYSKFTAIFRTIGAAAGVGGLGDLALKALEIGDNLHNAAIKAGISGQAMSELAYAGKKANVDLSSLSTALQSMQTSLSKAGSGAAKPIAALNALGLTVREIKGLKPEQQFELLADRINQLKDPADRARAATDLFGKSGADLLPLFEKGADGIRQARMEAEKIGASFSDKQIKALSDANTSVTKLKGSFEGFAVSLVSKVAPALTLILEKLTQLSQGDWISKLAPLLKNAGPIGQSLALELALGNRILNAPSKKRVVPGRRGGDPSVNGSALPADAPGYADYTTDNLSFIYVTARKVHAQALAEIFTASKTEADSEVEAMKNKFLDIKELEDEGVITHQEAEKRRAYWTDYYDRAQLTDVVVTAKSTTKTISEISQLSIQAAQDAQQAFKQFLFDPFNNGLKGMLSGFIDIIRNMVAEAAASKLFGSKSSGGFGIGDLIQGGVGSFLGSLFGGPKASGGPLQSGKWYTAGEHGPEPIWGGGPGAFATGYGGGRSGDVVVNVDARGSTMDSARFMAAKIPDIIKQAVNLSRAAVRDDISRYGRSYAS